ncbi:MAG: B12-binding domain-containing radical SAM protein [Candidatus Abyssubacteria bacterium]
MLKNVLLIAPYIHDFAAYDLWLKPVGLLYVAAAAERAGCKVRLINCLDRLHPAASAGPSWRRARTHPHGKGKFSCEVIPRPSALQGVSRNYKRYGIPPDALRSELAGGPGPDIIGVGSMMTYWCGGVAETIAIAREVFPGVPVVLGGVYATLCPEHARRYSGADLVVEGPGEERFLNILGIETSAEDDCLLDTLRPAYHLLGRFDSVSMMTSFGCPFACAYCASRIVWGNFRQRPVADVVAELTHYARETRVRDVAFYDDALLWNPGAHIKPILREVIRCGLGLRLHTPNGLHANLIDRELAILMKAAGFTTIRLSLESIDEMRLRDSSGKVSPSGFETAMTNLFSAGYIPGDIEAYVMMGIPGQPPEEVERTMRFAHGLGAVIRLADFSPIPGTRCFDEAVRLYGLDAAEPLLQNSSVLPLLVHGLSERYERHKSRAHDLNMALKSGRCPVSGRS